MDFQRSNQQQQMNVGLTRYRSAPSSYFSSFLDTAANTISSSGGYGGDDLDHFLNRYMPSNRISTQQAQDLNASNSFSTSMSMQSQSQVVAPMKQEPETMQPQQLQQQQQQRNQNDYSQVSQMMYQNQCPPQAQVQQNPNSEVSNASSMNNSYRLPSSMNSKQLAPMKMGSGGGNSNLTRYNSSPAELFANINIENEYGAMRGMGDFGAGNNANAEASFSSASKFKGQMDFSSAQASSSGLMSPISEISTGETKSGDRNFGEGHRNSAYITGFPVTSWDDSAIFSDSFLKGLGDDDDDDNKKLSNVFASENQNNEGSKNRPPTLLSHHLSLPKNSEELSAMETLMQDSVLCKLRAKRGCATHPRSIAERVRRTRISERMRKLQELVPNMDKQTNTSDMLDLAVDYIKDLQKQVQALSDNRAKCKCFNQ